MRCFERDPVPAFLGGTNGLQPKAGVIDDDGADRLGAAMDDGRELITVLHLYYPKLDRGGGE